MMYLPGMVAPITRSRALADSMSSAGSIRSSLSLFLSPGLSMMPWTEEGFGPEITLIRLNYFGVDYFLLRGSSEELTKVVSVGPTAVHSRIAPCSVVPAK